MIEFKGLQKKFGEITVIETEDVKLDSGIYWLQGPNGSGKTTLLRMVAGLLPFKGDILIDAISQKKFPLEYRRLVSWADAEPIYPGFITGMELVNFYRHVRKVKLMEVDPLIDLFRVRHFLNTPIGSYSSGMTKKLSLLLAFIGRPRMILLDEPLITLDQETVPTVHDLIMDYSLKKNTDFLISSHQDFVEKIFSVEKKILIADQTLHLLF